MKTKLKRITAMMLCIITVLSLFAEGFAAGEPDPNTPAVTSVTYTQTKDATDTQTDRPQLYVDFLGDNAGHNPYTAAADTGDAATGTPGRAANKEQAKKENVTDILPYGGGGTWERYGDPDPSAAAPELSPYFADANNDGWVQPGEERTIFYVGVGIDRMNLLRMLADKWDLDGNGVIDETETIAAGNQGIYSFEAGFYYNPEFVEPYVHQYDATKPVNDNYLKTIEQTNLYGSTYGSYIPTDTSNAAWDGANYHVIEALTGLEPQLDGGLVPQQDGSSVWSELTQEVIINRNGQSGNRIIMDQSSEFSWKMTYVSLEMNVEATLARLKNAYTGSADDNMETEYLLIIPFVLKKYDPQTRLCFRLIRNATHFTMGAYPDGADTRAAWERVTSRNAVSNLKLQTMFTGDLNIFTGKKEGPLENRYKATLVVDKGGSSQNLADVRIDNDPAPNPAHITEDGEELIGLAGGTGMQVKTSAPSRYTVKVNVYRAADPVAKTPLATFYEPATTVNDTDRRFEFIMPEEDVIVEITFILDPNAPKDFYVILDEWNREGTATDTRNNNTSNDGSPIDRPDVADPVIVGNFTTITGKLSPRTNASWTADEQANGKVNTTNSLGGNLSATPPVLPRIEATASDATWTNTIDIKTTLHPDYIAEVRFYTVNNISFAPDSYDTSRASLRNVDILDGGGNKIGTEYVLTLNSGTDASPNNYTFSMRATEVYVKIDYLLATQYEASLKIKHVNDVKDDDGNIIGEKLVDASVIPDPELDRAQLNFTGYRDDNLAEVRYGGVWRDGGITTTTTAAPDPGDPDITVVTENADVEITAAPNNANILPIPVTSAVWSGSVSGDRAPDTLDNLMRAAEQCVPADPTATPTAIPEDLTPVTSNFTASDFVAMGLRKNAAGDYFTEAEITSLLAPALLELNEYIMDPANSLTTDYTATYQVPVDPADLTQGYNTITYPNLSLEMLQVWILDAAEVQAQFAADPDVDIFAWAHNYLAANPMLTQGVAVTGGWTKWDQADTPAPEMKARAGRTMRVVTRADSGYTVRRIVVREVLTAEQIANNVTPRELAATDITKDARYTNVYSFAMPAWNAEVEVVYAPRNTIDLKLIVNAPVAQADNSKVELFGRVAVQGSEYTLEEKITKNGQKIKGVLSGGTGRLYIKDVPNGYTVKVTVYTDSGVGITTTVVGGGSIQKGSTITFPIPNEDTTVNVVFSKETSETHTAYIRVEGYGGTVVGGSSAKFTTTNLSIMTGAVGTPLPGVVTVPEGYYIYSVTALGDSGSYPYVQSGNGWNNYRPGSTTVTIDSHMPNEDIVITAVLREGPPPPEPELPVTLLVRDTANDGGNSDPKVYADNWARMDVGGAGYGVHVVDYPFGAEMTDYAHSETKYTAGGTEVVVEVNCTDDYYIFAAVVTPSNLSIVVEWIDETHFKFTTPPESCAVTVQYLKKVDGKVPPRPLTVKKTETIPAGATDTLPDANNKFEDLKVAGTTVADPTATPPITIEWDNTYEVEARKKVTATVKVDDSIATPDNWYIKSVRMVRDGVTSYLTLSPTANPNEYTIEFYMPARNIVVGPDETAPADSGVTLIVDYRRGQLKAGEHVLNIVVQDPDNDGLDAGNNPIDKSDNWAMATVGPRDGSANVVLGKYSLAPSTAWPAGETRDGSMAGSTVACFGDKVVVEWHPDTGFALDILLITSSGRTIYPAYSYTPPVAADPVAGTPAEPAKYSATFDMPNDDTTVLVRFKEGDERLYRADIVIYDATRNSDNRASFEPLTANVADDVYNRSGLHGGEHMKVHIEAADGYYIKSVSVAPSATGVAVQLTGAFGAQSATFNMPMEDVQVNVVFEKKWPDEAGFDVELTVIDPSDKAGNFGHAIGKFTDADKVHGGETKVVETDVVDGTIVGIHVHTATGSRIKSITIYDSAGNEVPWYWGGLYPNMVRFAMPPSHVEVVVEYEDGDPAEYTATLHVLSNPAAPTASGTATLAICTTDPDLTPPGAPTASTDPDDLVTRTTVGTSAIVNKVHMGDQLMLTVTPGTGFVVAEAYAVSSDGKALELRSLNDGEVPVVPVGGSTTFAVPKASVDVYVRYALEPDKDTDQYATLYVSGDPNSGYAKLYSNWANTGTVAPNGSTSTFADNVTGSGYIVVGGGARVKVDITPQPGYAIKSIRILDRLRNNVDYSYVATSGELVNGSTVTISYIQPIGASRVYVEFEKIDPNRTYNARVVVNNAGEADNTAAIAEHSATPTWVKLIDPAAAGSQIDIDIKCKSGYEYEIIVVPQSHGIHPTLTLPNNRSQKTSFVMPADDVIVYVRFSTDTRTRYTVSLSVGGGQAGTTSAGIKSDFNTTELSALSGGAVLGSPQIVRAAPEQNGNPAETVTVDTRTGGNLPYVVTSISVTTTSGVPVPYTLRSDGTLWFPMVASNVNVVVMYGLTAPKYDLTLHVINHHGVANGLATLTQRDNTANKTSTVSVGGRDTIPMEAGKIVDLAAEATDTAGNIIPADKVGILDVYVKYADGTPYAGQFVPLNINTRTYGTGDAAAILKSLAADFAMQPYDLDVYVVVAEETKFLPNGTAIWLSVVGPDANAGSATLTTDYVPPGPNSEPTATPVTVVAPNGLDYLPATPGSYASIQLNINTTAGYQLESITITPIGVDADKQVVGSLCALTMPNVSIRVEVKIKKVEINSYLATLHVANIGTPQPTVANVGEIGYDVDASTRHYANTQFSSNDGQEYPEGSGNHLDKSQLIIPEGTQVDLFAYINDPQYYLLSAYVLTTAGSMVPIDPDATTGLSIEGSKYDPDIAPGVPDARSGFVMPASDVDVYVVYTNITPPPDGWRTTALVVTDADAAGNLTNTGTNTASITEEVAGDFIYEMVYANNVLTGINPPVRVSETTPYSADVQSFGNSSHKAYIVMPGKGVYVAERPEVSNPDYAFLPPATISTSDGSVVTPTSVSANPYRYFYTTIDAGTTARMHYIEGTTRAGDLTVELVDKQNPGNLVVKNVVKVVAGSKAPLTVTSSDSAGAWQKITQVDPGTNIAISVQPWPGYAATATIEANGQTTAVPLVRAVNGSYSASITMPSGNAKLTVTFVRGYTATLNVINRSGSPATVDLVAPNGDMVTNSGTLVGLLGDEEMKINSVLGAGDITSVIYSGNNHAAHATKRPENDYWNFTMPKEDTVVNVIIDDGDTPVDPRMHTAILCVDPLSESGWEDACSLDGIVDETNSHLPSGYNWTAAYVRDVITASFTAGVHNGVQWYASVYAIVRDPDGTIGERVRPVYAVQSGTTGNCTAGMTMPDDNVEIIVRFTKTNPNPDPQPYDLSLALEGLNPAHTGNSATATSGAVSLSVNDAAPTDGPQQVLSGSTVNVNAAWGTGYRFMGADVEVVYDYTITEGGVTSNRQATHRMRKPMTTSGSAASGSFVMPMLNLSAVGVTSATDLHATVKVVLKFGYDATLTVYDRTTAKDVSSTLTAGQSVTVNSTGRDTITGIPYNTNSTTAVGPATHEYSVIGRNDVDGATVLTAPNYDYAIVEDSEIVVIASDGGAGDRVYAATVKLHGATADEWATIRDTSDATQPFGNIWTAAKQYDGIKMDIGVGAQRSARVKVTRGSTPNLSPTALRIGADTTYTFTMPASDVQIDVYYTDMPLVRLGVVDRSGVATGNSVTLTSSDGAIGQFENYASNGSVNGIVGSYSGDFATITVGTTNTADSKVTRIFVEDASGNVTDISTSKTFNQLYYGDKIEKTVWVIFDKVTTEPTDKRYVTYITASGDSGWQAAGNRIGEVIDTTAILDNIVMATGDHWSEGRQGDNMRALFETAPGWYAVVQWAKKVPSGTNLLVMQQNNAMGGTASITQPDSDARIHVHFTTTPPTTTHSLDLRIHGHDNQEKNMGHVVYGANSVTANGLDDATNTGADVIKPVAANVPFGTQIPLDATWADGYRILKIEVSNKNDPNAGTYLVPWNEYADTGSAFFYMPNEDAIVTVYFTLQYTATLHIENNGLIGGGAEMWSSSDPTTIVNTHLDKLENLGGGETISTKAAPVPTGGRLVKVIYETAKTGAHATVDHTALPSNSWDFTMPQENTDVYVLYEDENDRSYVAWVELAGEYAGMTLGANSNTAHIKNTSRETLETRFSTLAKAGDRIRITVDLLPGYQAKVVFVDTAGDERPYPAGLYVSRTQFGVTGKTTEFTMPANSDAIVRIEFIKGYTATLVLNDSTEISDTVRMTDDTLPTIGTNVPAEGKTIVVATNATTAIGAANYDKYVGGSGGSVTHTNEQTITEIGVGTALDGDVVLGASATKGSKLYQLLETTANGGTRSINTWKLKTDGGTTLPVSTDPTATPQVMTATANWIREALLATEPVEDVTITAVIIDADDDSMLAKVMLEGESDINQNDAMIENTASVPATPPPAAWQTGTIWTTALDENLIKVGVSLAPGHTATVIAISDKVYQAALAALAGDTTLTDEQKIEQARTAARLPLIFGSDPTTTPFDPDQTELYISTTGTAVSAKMPGCALDPTDTNFDQAKYDERSDITFIVTFSAEAGPRPYDPMSERYEVTPPTGEAYDLLETGWIYGVNHGDYATITVPTLNTGKTADNDNEILQDVYREEDPDTPTVEGFSYDFRIYVEVNGTFVALDNTTEIRLYPVDSKTVPDDYRYNIDNYYTGEGKYNHITDYQTDINAIDHDGTDGYEYTGAKFNIELRDVAEDDQSDAYKEFANILATDSYSTAFGTRLKIRTVGQNGSLSDDTQLVIPQYFALEGTLVSYAPQHEAVLSMYDYDTATNTYKTSTETVNYLRQSYGDGLWRQDFRVMSSEFAGRDRSAVKTDLDKLLGVTGANGFSTKAGEEYKYKLTIEKVSAITYTRTGIVLTITNGKASNADLLGADERTWILARPKAAPAASTLEVSPSVTVVDASTVPTVTELPAATDEPVYAGESEFIETTEAIAPAEPVETTEVEVTGPVETDGSAEEVEVTEPVEVATEVEAVVETEVETEAEAVIETVEPADIEVSYDVVELTVETFEAEQTETEAEADEAVVDEPTVDEVEPENDDRSKDEARFDVEFEGEQPTDELSDEQSADKPETEGEKGDEPATEVEPDVDDETVVDDPTYEPEVDAEPDDELDVDDEQSDEIEIVGEVEITADEDDVDRLEISAEPFAAGDVVRDVIILMTGDVRVDGRVKVSDYNLLMSYMGGQYSWTKDNQGDAGWEISTLNPDSVAYRCDLNGDGAITSRDLAILTDEYNYNHSAKDYGAKHDGLTREWMDVYDTTVNDYLKYVNMGVAPGAAVLSLSIVTVEASVVEPVPDEQPNEDAAEPDDEQAEEPEEEVGDEVVDEPTDEAVDCEPTDGEVVDEVDQPTVDEQPADEAEQSADEAEPEQVEPTDAAEPETPDEVEAVDADEPEQQAADDDGDTPEEEPPTDDEAGDEPPTEDEEK